MHWPLGLLARLPLAVLVAILLVAPLQSRTAHAVSTANFNAGRIMDDDIFFGSAGMSASDIQTFLSSKVPVCDTNGTQMYGSMTRAQYSATQGFYPPFTCLKDYSESVPNQPADSYCSGAVSAGTQSAAQIVYNVANACGINAKVLLVLLQKEQGLITDDWPWPTQYQKATGYGCPDGAPCDSQYYGFFNQVYNAAHQFQRYVKQANLFNYQARQSAYVAFNPSSSCGGSTIFIQNQATADLYNYTPYQPNQASLDAGLGTAPCGAYGNRNFYIYYSDWFGPTTSAFCSLAAANPVQADVQFGKTEIGSSADFAHLILYEGTSTDCIESHEWSQGYGTWQQHVASNMPVVDPRNAIVRYASLAGGNDVPVLVGLNGTGSGMVEFHVWNSGMNAWTLHVASNMGAISPDNATVDFADVDGSGKDVPVLVGYNGTGSGNVEFHVWNSDLRTWKVHAATTMGPISPTNAQIIFADVDGSGKDVPVMVGLQGSGSGMIEFHVWSSDLHTWSAHYASNQPQF